MNNLAANNCQVTITIETSSGEKHTMFGADCLVLVAKETDAYVGVEPRRCGTASEGTRIALAANAYQAIRIALLPEMNAKEVQEVIERERANAIDGEFMGDEFL